MCSNARFTKVVPAPDEPVTTTTGFFFDICFSVDTDVDNLGESFFASADYTSIKKFAQEIESIISKESFVKKKFNPSTYFVCIF
jgi:hypothetical protein